MNAGSEPRDEPETADPGAAIWRYMDDWKLQDMLKRFAEHDKWKGDDGDTVYFNEPGQLWFSYPYTFEKAATNKEGQFPGPNTRPGEYCDLKQETDELSDEEACEGKERVLAADTETLRDGISLRAQLCGVSCWHENDAESEKMWKNFTRRKNAVAIRSTVEAVTQSFTHAHNTPVRNAAPSLCAVGYVNHATFFLEADGFRSLLALIRKRYSYQNEIRFVAKSPELSKIPTKVTVPWHSDPEQWSKELQSLSSIDKQKFITETTTQCRDAFEVLKDSKERGFHLPARLDDLIHEVVLKPGCEDGYEELVRKQLSDVGLSDISVSRSQL